MRVLFCLLFAASAFGQTLTFDAASVKPNNLEDHIVTIDVGPGGRFAARGYTLKLLIQQAYEIKGFQILGGAGWLDVDRFDIAARGRANATRHQVNQMLQSLLAERFGLRLHAVQRAVPGFALEATGAKAKLMPSQSAEEEQSARRDETGALVGHAFSMPSFAKMVGGYVSKPVVDSTGMKGLYDFRIHWTDRADQVSEQPEGISLISALRDQLGLKLVSKRVMADLVQIDAASRPGAD